jgi:hypothetical protein
VIDQCTCPKGGASSTCPSHGDRPLTTDERVHRGIVRPGGSMCTDNDCWCMDPAQNPWHYANEPRRSASYDFASHWLKEQIALTKTQLRRCTNAMELIANSETSYAKGHRVMIEAHTKVLAVYQGELDSLTALEQTHVSK